MSEHNEGLDAASRAQVVRADQMKEDGIACARDKAMLIAQKDKPNQHCFVCNDNDSMTKCAADPLASGCTETPCTAK